MGLYCQKPRPGWVDVIWNIFTPSSHSTKTEGELNVRLIVEQRCLHLKYPSKWTDGGSIVTKGLCVCSQQLVGHPPCLLHKRLISPLSAPRLYSEYIIIAETNNSHNHSRFWLLDLKVITNVSKLGILLWNLYDIFGRIDEIYFVILHPHSLSLSQAHFSLKFCNGKKM